MNKIQRELKCGKFHLTLSNAFWGSRLSIILGFAPFLAHVIIFSVLRILSAPCLPGVKPFWSGLINLVICLLLARILVKNIWIITHQIYWPMSPNMLGLSLLCAKLKWYTKFDISFWTTLQTSLNITPKSSISQEMWLLTLWRCSTLCLCNFQCVSKKLLQKSWLRHCHPTTPDYYSLHILHFFLLDRKPRVSLHRCHFVQCCLKVLVSKSRNTFICAGYSDCAFTFFSLSFFITSQTRFLFFCISVV